MSDIHLKTKRWPPLGWAQSEGLDYKVERTPEGRREEKERRSRRAESNRAEDSREQQSSRCTTSIVVLFKAENCKKAIEPYLSPKGPDKGR